MSGRAIQLCLRALGNMAPRLPCLMWGPRALCGHGASGSVGGRNGGVIAGGCVWQDGAEGRPGGRWEGGSLSVVAGACRGCPWSRLPWTVRDQPSSCWMTRVGSEAKREACRAGVMEANACPRRASASLTYTTVRRLWVRVTAMEVSGPRRRAETWTMPDAASEEPTLAKVGTEEVGAAPVAEGAGAPGRGGWLRRGGAESGAGAAAVPGACKEGAGGAEEPKQNQSRSIVEGGGRAVLV